MSNTIKIGCHSLKTEADFDVIPSEDFTQLNLYNFIKQTLGNYIIIDDIKFKDLDPLMSENIIWNWIVSNKHILYSIDNITFTECNPAVKYFGQQIQKLGIKYTATAYNNFTFYSFPSLDVEGLTLKQYLGNIDIFLVQS